jgi:hypothetical protein
LQNSIDQTKLVAQTIAVNEKSIQIFFSGQLGSINSPTGLSKIDAKSSLALQKRGPDTELLEPVMPTSTVTIAEATSALSAIGIANVIGTKVEEGITRIQSLAKSKGSKCSTSGHISLPISEEAATIANYVTCYKDTTSVEYRIHTEKASLVNASPESPIVYVNISYQRPVTKDIEPTQSEGEAPTFDGFANGLRKPASDLVKEGFFVTNWTVDKWNVSILGFCSNMQSDASTCDNNKRIITGVRLWQN